MESNRRNPSRKAREESVAKSEEIKLKIDLKVKKKKPENSGPAAKNGDDAAITNSNKTSPKKRNANVAKGAKKKILTGKAVVAPQLSEDSEDDKPVEKPTSKNGSEGNSDVESPLLSSLPTKARINKPTELKNKAEPKTAATGTKKKVLGKQALKKSDEDEKLASDPEKEELSEAEGGAELYPKKKGRSAKAPSGKAAKSKTAKAGEKQALEVPEVNKIFGSDLGSDNEEEETPQVDSDDEPSPKKSRTDKAPNRKAAKKAAEAEPSSSQASNKLQNEVNTDYGGIDFSIKEKFNFKVSFWNVGGLRALVKKNPNYFEHEDANVVCMSELKCGSEKEVPEEVKLKGYHAYWNLEKGAPGVGLLSKTKPLNVWNDIPDSEFSNEKRMITAEFKDFYLVAVYVVNAGAGLKTLGKRLKWNKVFDEYVLGLDKKKPVIIAGDMNVAHAEIDLANPASNKKNAGFTQEERDGFSHLLSLGFVDTYRHFHPNDIGSYTFWSYRLNARPKNVGWRLDYFVVSKRFMKHVKENVIRSKVLGSDHCPIVLFLNL